MATWKGRHNREWGRRCRSGVRDPVLRKCRALARKTSGYGLLKAGCSQEWRPHTAAGQQANLRLRAWAEAASLPRNGR